MPVVRPWTVLAAAGGLAAVACAPSTRLTTGAETRTEGRAGSASSVAAFDPPAEVLDTAVVYLDADGTGEALGSRPPDLIADPPALDRFAARYVDGDPPLGTAADRALANGKVLVGGVVSRGCFPAEGAMLAYSGVDLRLFPSGPPPDDPDVVCARAVTSVALVALDPALVPEGLPIIAPES